MADSGMSPPRGRMTILSLPLAGYLVVRETDSQQAQREDMFRANLLAAETEQERVDLILTHALDGEDPALLTTTAGRHALCEYDPLLFAVLYLSHHLKSQETGNQISFSRAHLVFCDIALSWTEPQTLESHRDAVVAARGSGKSTWLLLILPLWALAFGHVKFCAGFADVSSQAELHLASVRKELSNNALLRQDFPLLCKPIRRDDGTYEPFSDTMSSIMLANGGIYLVKGVDRPIRGMKVGNRRPDLIAIDDAEKSESQYSPTRVAQRLETIRKDILQLELTARVIFVGTTTRVDSIIHQLVKSVRGLEETEPWIKDLKFHVHDLPALVTDPDGVQRSSWPSRWNTQWLLDNVHRDDVAQELMNEPNTLSPTGWRKDSFHYESCELYTSDRKILVIDGAVTTKSVSDETGLAVVSATKATKRCHIHEAIGVRLSGEPLRQKVLDMLVAHPDISLVVVEANQGGDLWKSVLHDMPVRIHLLHNKEPKEVRLRRLKSHFERGNSSVWMTKRLPQFETQAMAWPQSRHDDIIDAVSTGEWCLVSWLFIPKPRAGAKLVGY